MDIEFAETNNLLISLETDYLQDLVCNVCEAEFLEKEDLEVHIEQLHLNGRNKSRFCELCTYIFSDIELYALHLRDTHLANLKCCKYCTRMFFGTTEAIEHEKKHKSAALYPKVSCSQCGAVFNSKIDMKSHEFKEHEDCNDGLMLRDCLPILSSLLCMNIETFFAATYSSLSYKCVVCTITTVDMKTYIEHLVNSKNCRGYSCNECYNVYSTKYRLRRHMQSLHNKSNDSKEFVTHCKKCKLPLRAGELKFHVKKCSGIYCTHCELYFVSVQEYTNHRLTAHKTMYPSVEVCIYCQRQMIGADNMKKHVDRVHKHEIHLYKYHCNDCRRLFKHPKFLFAHFFSKHKDLNPYTCKICNKTFRIRKGFSLHIKLAHKSVGSVEFDDNFHVYFTDKKLKKSTNQTDLDNVKGGTNGNNEQNDEALGDNEPIGKDEFCELEISLEPDIKEFNDSVKAENAVKNHDNQNQRDNNEITDNGEIIGKPVKKSLKYKRKPPLKRKHIVKKLLTDNANGGDVSSDDSDIPLHTVSKKLKSRKIRKSKSKRNKPTDKKFFCNICNKNCYTYQNYQRHRALHVKNETKVCIKCYGKFDSVKKLDNHMKKEHSSSKLTETLRKVLEKRKFAEQKSITIVNTKKIIKKTDFPDYVKELIPYKVISLSTSDKFRNTIKKVNVERNVSTKVTMKLVDKISVKKYLENFIPDSNDVKIAIVKDRDLLVKKPRHLIKLIKFNDPEQELLETKLKMPVKFANDVQEKFDVSIKLVSGHQNPAMTFDNNIEDNYTETYDDYTYDNSEVEVESKEIIPEVAQEIMLGGSEEKNSIVHTMTLKNVSNLNDVAIAHLSAEAPYFKIAKINLDSEGHITLKSESKVKDETQKNITLPNGKKFVSVNPFQHLLDKKVMEELANSKKTRRDYYKPKIRNVAEAITSAILKLDSDKHKEKKKAK